MLYEVSLPPHKHPPSSAREACMYVGTTAAVLCHAPPLLRRTIVNRTYGTHKNLDIYLFLLTMFGPTGRSIYYGPPPLALRAFRFHPDVTLNAD